MDGRPAKGMARRKRRGQSMLEMAVIAPFMAMLLCLVIDFGYLLYVNVAVHNAARDASLMGFFKNQYSEAEIKANLLNHSGIPGLTSAEITTCTTHTMTVSSQARPTFEVSILHRHNFLAPAFFTQDLGINLVASAKTIVATDYDGGWGR